MKTHLGATTTSTMRNGLYFGYMISILHGTSPSSLGYLHSCIWVRHRQLSPWLHNNHLTYMLDTEHELERFYWWDSSVHDLSFFFMQHTGCTSNISPMDTTWVSKPYKNWRVFSSMRSAVRAYDVMINGLTYASPCLLDQLTSPFSTVLFSVDVLGKMLSIAKEMRCRHTNL